jgi:oleate hydratase
MTVTEIHFASTKTGATGLIHVEPHDIVIVTLGSMTASSSLGTNSTPPKPLPTPERARNGPDGAWELWSTLANPDSNPQFWGDFGNPSNFYSRVKESNWLSFTVTLKNTSFIEQYEKWSGNKAGTGALVTFKDSSWLMSIVVPHQPHFLNQAQGTQVFRGYGLFPANIGDFVKKPMAECSGEEILKELLGHLQFPEQPILGTSITIPSMLPYITSQFLTRKAGDRPPVIPRSSTNLALLGQFVEIPKDTVFTVEYSVRAAQIAVHELMGTKRKPKDIYRGEHSVKVLVEALRMLLT